MDQSKIREVFINHSMNNGRMISWSKSEYRQNHPDHEVYFNANIFTLKEGKIWYGDLDLTADESKLTQIAKDLNTDIYILSEMDGRFENEKSTEKQIIENSKKIIKCK